jgi:hypothetical protein
MELSQFALQRVKHLLLVPSLIWLWPYGHAGFVTTIRGNAHEP